MRIGLAQLNPTVGDLDGNERLILNSIKEAESAGCSLVIFPELALTGYPPEDLLLKPAFVEQNAVVLRRLAKSVRSLAAVVGFVDLAPGKRLNAAAWIERGRIQTVYHKQCLPNYGVFDERRYFVPGNKTVVRTVSGIRIGLTICEDIWILGPHLTQMKSARPHLVVNISASPFHSQKLKQRWQIAKKAATSLRAPILYCNMVGGQDELVFDGGSFGVDARGRVVLQEPQFESGLALIDIEKTDHDLHFSRVLKGTSQITRPKLMPPPEEIFRALVLGTRDYVRKNRFEKVVIGLSGGIDSALVACIAVEALGADNVVAVTMPTRYNSSEGRSDVTQLCTNLGIRLIEIPIQSVFDQFLRALTAVSDDWSQGLAQENLQARIRGTTLMTLSNRFGWLVLTTGNKSETSTGYCTLYGDMAGGFDVLKDVLKTTVYMLARWINENHKPTCIPPTIIARPPSAELSEGQKDEDVLGPYSHLDPIVRDYVENNRSLSELVRRMPAKKEYVKKVITMIDRSEYKRRQAPPGIKITPRSFGRDHRMPITNRYRV